MNLIDTTKPAQQLLNDPDENAEIALICPVLDCGSMHFRRFVNGHFWEIQTANTEGHGWTETDDDEHNTEDTGHWECRDCGTRIPDELEEALSEFWDEH